MVADDIQPTPSTPVGSTMAPMAVQSAGAPVSAEALGRWTRAVTALPMMSPEKDADSLFSDQPKQPDPSEPVHQPPAHRLGQQLPPAVSFNAASNATSNTDSRAELAPVPPAHVQVQALPSGSASLAAVQQIPTPKPTPLASPAATSPTAGAAFAAAGPTTDGALAPVRQDGSAQRNDNSAPRDMDSPVATATPTSTQTTRSTLGPMDTDSARALPLSALRGRHASHRDGRLDAALTDRVNAERSPQQPTTPVATADAWMARVQAPPSPDSSVGFDAANPAGGSEQLHALIESCCSRLWVSDGGGRVPQGVMLDLGRWMPGCTVEVAKAAGVLRITLRGVEGSDRQRLEEELTGLGDGLAQKLGCQVVAAVATNKELT